MTPDEFTRREEWLDVGDGHQLYVHDWGNPDAEAPILFLHGGPGSGCQDSYKTTFDPAVQRVIFFDQRGAGRSLPSGSRKHNTTPDLVEDIERIVVHLKLRTVILTGGSWGSCLALAYGIRYPKRVTTMVLRGIFTGSQAEIDWISQGHFAPFFPETWDRYLDATPAKYRDNPSAYHFQRAFGNDPAAVKASAYAVNCLEGAILSLDDRFTPQPFETFESDGTLIEMHYMANRCFMPDRHILDNAHQLKMPVWLIQGRYDMVCPPATAYELEQRLGRGRLVWTVAGHGGERALYDIHRSLLLQLTGVA